MRRFFGGAAVLAILAVMVVMGKRNTSVCRYLGKPHADLFDHDVIVPSIPEDVVEAGEPFSLECSIELRPTPKMDAWLSEHDTDADFGFEDGTSIAMVEFPDARTARLFDREFGVFMPEGKTKHPKG
jgi:hypothetical protein